jgi:hypothetical protein
VGFFINAGPSLQLAAAGRSKAEQSKAEQRQGSGLGDAVQSHQARSGCRQYGSQAVKLGIKQVSAIVFVEGRIAAVVNIFIKTRNYRRFL